MYSAFSHEISIVSYLMLAGIVTFYKVTARAASRLGEGLRGLDDRLSKGWDETWWTEHPDLEKKGKGLQLGEGFMGLTIA